VAQVDHLDCTISQKSNILVAAFIGTISVHTISLFEKFAQEIIEARSAKFIAIDLSGLENISLEGVPGFVRLQKIIRDRNQAFRISGLSEDLKAKLNKLGVIRFPELTGHLKESLQYAIQLPQPAQQSSPESKKAS
jgi:anti-anti-sigma regulatory factor